VVPTLYNPLGCETALGGNLLDPFKEAHTSEEEEEEEEEEIKGREAVIQWDIQRRGEGCVLRQCQ